MDVPFQEALVFLRFVVIGVLGKIAHLDRRAQPLGYFLACRSFELLQLSFEAGCAFRS